MRARVNRSVNLHELAVSQVKASLIRAATASESIVVREFSTCPKANRFLGLSPCEPDGFVRIIEMRGNQTREHLFYLEVDRSTEPLAVLESKAQRYSYHRYSGQFAEQCPRSKAIDCSGSFRVMFVLHSNERRNNFIEVLLRMKPQILTQVYLCTMPEVLTNPLGAIWVRPLDYRDAATGTVFDRDYCTHRQIYGRQLARDRIVESRIEKRTLFQ